MGVPSTKKKKVVVDNDGGCFVRTLNITPSTTCYDFPLPCDTAYMCPACHSYLLDDRGGMEEEDKPHPDQWHKYNNLVRLPKDACHQPWHGRHAVSSSSDQAGSDARQRYDAVHMWIKEQRRKKAKQSSLEFREPRSSSQSSRHREASTASENSKKPPPSAASAAAAAQHCAATQPPPSSQSRRTHTFFGKLLSPLTGILQSAPTAATAGASESASSSISPSPLDAPLSDAVEMSRQTDLVEGSQPESSCRIPRKKLLSNPTSSSTTAKPTATVVVASSSSSEGVVSQSPRQQRGDLRMAIPRKAVVADAKNDAARLESYVAAQQQQQMQAALLASSHAQHPPRSSGLPGGVTTGAPNHLRPTTPVSSSTTAQWRAEPAPPANGSVSESSSDASESSAAPPPPSKRPFITARIPRKRRDPSPDVSFVEWTPDPPTDLHNHLAKFPLAPPAAPHDPPRQKRRMVSAMGSTAPLKALTAVSAPSRQIAYQSAYAGEGVAPIAASAAKGSDGSTVPWSLSSARNPSQHDPSSSKATKGPMSSVVDATGTSQPQSVQTGTTAPLNGSPCTQMSGPSTTDPTQNRPLRASATVVHGTGGSLRTQNSLEGSQWQATSQFASASSQPHASTGNHSTSPSRFDNDVVPLRPAANDFCQAPPHAQQAPTNPPPWNAGNGPCVPIPNNPLPCTTVSPSKILPTHPLAGASASQSDVPPHAELARPQASTAFPFWSFDQLQAASNSHIQSLRQRAVEASISQSGSTREALPLGAVEAALALPAGSPASPSLAQVRQQCSAGLNSTLEWDKLKKDVQQTVTETVKQCMRELLEQSMPEVIRQAVREAVVEAFEQSVKEGTAQVGRQATKHSLSDVVRDSVNETIKQRVGTMAAAPVGLIPVQPLNLIGSGNPNASRVPCSLTNGFPLSNVGTAANSALLTHNSLGHQYRPSANQVDVFNTFSAVQNHGSLEVILGQRDAPKPKPKKRKPARDAWTISPLGLPEITITDPNREGLHDEEPADPFISGGIVGSHFALPSGGCGSDRSI